MSGSDKKRARELRKKVEEAVRHSRIEVETEIKKYINESPMIQRIKFAGLVLAGRV